MRLRFGDWVFDGESRELLGRAGAAHLSPKAFDLLGVLLENRPRVVAKAELHDRLWAGTFVSDSNLASVVKEVRRALGDSVREPAFLRTVHGFGYSFCGEAREASRATGKASSSLACHFLAWGPNEILLAEGENVLGRGLEATVRVESATVSRRHARIVIAPEGAAVEDLGSKNGTCLNGRRLRGPSPLASGDVVSLGSERLTFRTATASATDDTLSSAEPEPDS